MRIRPTREMDRIGAETRNRTRIAKMPPNRRGRRDSARHGRGRAGVPNATVKDHSGPGQGDRVTRPPRHSIHAAIATAPRRLVETLPTAGFG